MNTHIPHQLYSTLQVVQANLLLFGNRKRHGSASMTNKIMEIAFGTIGIVVIAYIFASFYPLVGGTTGVVATVLANATSSGYVGATFVPLANLIPTVYVIGVIVSLVFMGLGLLRLAGWSGGKKGGRY